jgi:hypothetical protein
MSCPSIRGIALQKTLEDTARLLADGRISRERLEASVKPEDLRLLDETLVPTLWYPIAAYGAYNQLLWEVEGGGREEYLVERGRASARRIFETGTYAQTVETARKWGGDQVARVLISFSSTFYNFMHWEFQGDVYDSACAIDVRDAADFPDSGRFTAQGFIEQLYSDVLERRLLVRSERPQPDHVLYHIRTA